MSLVETDLNQGKPEKTASPPPLAELKNGKVIFRQRPISYESMSETMQEIVKFREYISEKKDTKEIPKEHLPLIAKLVHESDKTISTLVRNIQALLIPALLSSSSERGQDSLTAHLHQTVLESSVKVVARRVNYGITLPNTDKSPANLCIWRWETNNMEWLPGSVREMAKQRLEERRSAKNHLQFTFDSLSQEDKERMAWTSGKVTKSQDDPSCLTKVSKEGPEDVVNQAASVSAGPKKPVDTKEREKQEKKALKVERGKREAEATKKSAEVFANFFKPKGSTKTNAHTRGFSSDSSKPLSDFEKTFKPFALKKDVELAPINWFTSHRCLKRRDDSRQQTKGSTKDAPITVDDDDKELTEDDYKRWRRTNGEATHLSPQGLLRSFLDSRPSSLHHVGGTLSARRQREQQQYSVKWIIHKLNEAQVQGDQREVHRLTTLLRNRKKMPAKVLVFTENNRPGYLGTWTRSSHVINARRPLICDPLSFDYDYDSDAEWEEDDGMGEDVGSAGDSEDEDASSMASDLDDWLVNNDEIVFDTQEPSTPPNLGMKRKAPEIEEGDTKKRKVIPLIPFQKGPIWETEIGKNDYESFMSMRIQFFNDATFPLDPFSFVSTYVTAESLKRNSVIISAPSVSDGKDARQMNETGVKHKTVLPASIPKTSFPGAHIAFLLHKIRASNTGSFAVLVDIIFQDIKQLGIKKKALEVQLREVAEKNKEKKVWVVKDDAWTRYGLPRPTSIN